MSTNAVAINVVQLTGDENYDVTYSSGDLPDSIASNQMVVLLGLTDNEIEVPDQDGFDTHGVMIIPPNGNVNPMTLKGAALDTGVELSATKPSTILFGVTPPASIFLYSGGSINGLRLLWF
jgi:hypothetical protein